MSKKAPAMKSEPSNYKGDSPGKKMARALLWSRIVQHLREQHMTDTHIAYLASADGGDASALEALGWPAEQQLAIDQDAAALATFSTKYPKVTTALGDVRRILTSQPRQFGAVYLDFCGTATNAVLDTIAACVPCVKHNGRFAYTVLRARERGPKSTAVKQNGVAIKEFQAEVGAARTGINTEAMWESLKAMPTQERQQFERFHTRMTDGRTDLFQSYVQKKLTPARIAIPYVTSITYQSETDGSRGVPMLVDDWWVRYHGRGMELRKFEQARGRHALQIQGQRQRELLERMQEHMRLGWSMPPGYCEYTEAVGAMCVIADLADVTLANFIDFADEMEEAGMAAAKLLNTDEGVLNTWKMQDDAAMYPVGTVTIF